MRACLVRFLVREDAATAVEYAVMLGLFFMSAFVAATIFGQSALQGWQNNNNSLSNVSFGS